MKEFGRSVESKGKLTLTLRLPSDNPFHKTNPFGDEWALYDEGGSEVVE